MILICGRKSFVDSEFEEQIGGWLEAPKGWLGRCHETVSSIGQFSLTKPLVRKKCLTMCDIDEALFHDISTAQVKAHRFC